MSSKTYMKVTSDFTDSFNEVIARFKHDRVLVGIPEEDTTRKEDVPVNNATLLALNEFGSPANNIPARPVMAIGLKKAQPEITEIFKNGAKLALSKGLAALPIIYGRVGSVAANSVKKVINSQEGILPPSDATLAMRRAMGFKGTKALLVTGQMRNAITYVVKGKE